MVEALVSLVIKTLGEALGQEIHFLSETRDQFESLKSEFVSIKAFLKTADTYRSKDPRTLVWIADVQDLAYDVDDVLSTILLEVAKEKRRRANINPLLRWVFKLRKPVDLHKMGIEMSTILKKIEGVSSRRLRYGAEMGGGASSSSVADEVELRRVYPHGEDVDIVGLEEAASSLVLELKKEDDETLRVVSICGMGGLGKTTLAKLVYGRHDVASHFSLCAWTFISQQYRVEDVLKDILRQVSSLTKERREDINQVSSLTKERREDINSMTVDELVKELFNILNGRRYLIVLDDIWDVEAWDALKKAFPNGIMGSKVMLTTRNNKVAKEADPWSHPFTPKILSEDIAWELLRKKSFPRQAICANSSLSSDLEKCGREMLKVCGGLPLAIVVLGGILCSKTSLDEWQIVSEEISLHMREGGHAGVHAILGLSYISLPLDMKYLFLYLGLFPEDHKISVSTVTRMWIAEGLVRPIDGSKLSMEAIGKRYWDELIERNMVQVAETNLQGNVKACQMHDLMRDFCIDKAKKENFLQIIGKGESAPSSSNVKIRRCAFYLDDSRYELPTQAPSMRTMIFLNGSRITGKRMSPIVHFKLVRVLKLNYVELPKRFNKIIGKLLNLRYLSLRDSNIRFRIFSKSIGNLVNLEFLDLRGCMDWWLDFLLIGEKMSHFMDLLDLLTDFLWIVTFYGDMIWKLKELRHFHWDFYICEWAPPLRVDTLRNLQTLSWMRAESWTPEMLKLVHLQKLGICALKAGEVGAVIDSIVEGLPKMTSLSFVMYDEDKFSNLERLSEMQQLKKLDLFGGVNNFPKHWPSKLVKLRLSYSFSDEDPMPILEKLKDLVQLRLERAYKGKKIVCGGEGFPKLQSLTIAHFDEMEEWVVEKGAMPCLRTCIVVYCERLKMIPVGFKFVTTLQKLEIGMPASFSSRVKEGGEDWEIVKHIPSISIR